MLICIRIRYKYSLAELFPVIAIHTFRLIKKLFLSLLFLQLWTSLHAQSSYCRNLSFELGNFTNWTGYTWRYSQLVPSINSSPVKGIIDRRQTIMSDITAYDANTGYALKKIPPGYLYSARLGDVILSGDVNPRCWQQSLRYTMSIDSNNALLILKFALVLQYAIDHDQINEPRFKLTLFDSQGNVLPDCSNYDVYSSNKNVKGFKTYTLPGVRDPIEWRDWTTVGANLLKYLGQTITIEFMATDCTQRYHYGYAYFVAECHPLYITVKYCASDSIARLTAPEGFERYKWTNSRGIVVDTTQIYSIKLPEEKSTYSCTMTSATGCIVSLQTSVAKYIPKADFNSFMLDCKSNLVQFLNHSTKTLGSLSYNWNFYEGKNSYLENPAFAFKTSGIHKVTLTLSNPPSTCTDTLTRNIESFSPPLVGIKGDSTYCPGLTTSLKAYGANDYGWSNGSTSDSIKAGAPGGNYWLLGYSTTGCVSDTVYKKITEEPDWPLFKQGDSIICGEKPVTLRASGALTYLWNTGIKKDSIIASSPGIYSVKGANPRGCIKSLTYNVLAYPLPKVDFSFTPDALDRKHSILSCTIPAETGATYKWYTGDGFNEKGASINHEYKVSNDLLQYKVSLLARSSYNCTDSSFSFVDVIPFIPNVFTPNEDGINDLFMKGFEVEIIDRNGLVIFKGNNGWDGRHNGDTADPDTYFYLVTYKDGNEKIHSKKGYVTLIR
jgi:gliding motility-associated-like protein